MRKKKRKRTARKKGSLPLLVLGMGSIPRPGVPEIKIRYNRSRKVFLGKVRSSKDAADFIRKLYPRSTIELQENFIVLYCNNQLEIIGYYKHSIGSINSTVADIRLILGAALKSACTSILLAHNHPSRNTEPSEADIKITRQIQDAAKLMNIELLDHIIVTKKDFLSFASQKLF